MQYVFFGSPRFARLVLEETAEILGIPAAIVCNPDRPVGREGVITPPAVKMFVKEKGWGVPMSQPANKTELREVCGGLNADVYLVAAYGSIIPEDVLAIPRHGAVGVHPSLLPAYRGPSPLQSALLAGESRTGTTLFLLDKEMDHGPVLAERELEQDVSTLYYEELESLLATLGADLVNETLPRYVAGDIHPEPQDESRATYTRFFRTDDAFVPLAEVERALAGDAEGAGKIVRRIHAFAFEPGVWTVNAGGKRIKLLRGDVREGKLVLERVQYAGKKPTSFGGVL